MDYLCPLLFDGLCPIFLRMATWGFIYDFFVAYLLLCETRGTKITDNAKGLYCNVVQQG